MASEVLSTEEAGSIGHGEENKADWSHYNMAEIAALADMGLVAEVQTAAVTAGSRLVTFSAALGSGKGPAVGQRMIINGETHKIQRVESTTVCYTDKDFAATAAAGAVNTSIGRTGSTQQVFVTATLNTYISPASTTQFFGLDAAGIVYNVAAN